VTTFLLSELARECERATSFICRCFWRKKIENNGKKKKEAGKNNRAEGVVWVAKLAEEFFFFRTRLKGRVFFFL
jgi:hypothetical protein